MPLLAERHRGSLFSRLERDHELRTRLLPLAETWELRDRIRRSRDLELDACATECGVQRRIVEDEA